MGCAASVTPARTGPPMRFTVILIGSKRFRLSIHGERCEGDAGAVLPSVGHAFSK